MGWLEDFKRWRHRRRREHARRQKTGGLREFVYLDEVSVYSLLTSRCGPIAVEFTDTESRSLSAEMNADATADLIVAEAKLAGRAMRNVVSSTQVQRKSIVQTAFRDLYDLEAPAMILNVNSDESPGEKRVPPRGLGWGEYIRDGWAVSASQLTRGTLLELEVVLDTPSVFKTSSVVSAVLDLLGQNPELFSSIDDPTLSQVRAFDNILTRLLAGLVPIESKATEYEVATVGGEDFVAHRVAVDSLDPHDAASRRPLTLVGVAEERLFWRDTRRVLFSGARVRALCRVAQDSLHSDWTPVKLANVLESVVPGLSVQLDDSFRHVLETIRAGAGVAHSDARMPSDSMLSDILLEYAKRVAAECGNTLQDDIQTVLSDMAERNPVELESIEESRALFKQVDEVVLRDRTSKITAVRLAEIRDEVRNKTRPAPPFARDSSLIPPGLNPTTGPESAHMVDTEFVAIYW